MARLGVTMGELPGFIARLVKLGDVKVSGLMTHLASADAPSVEETEEQMRRFDEATRLLRERGIVPEVRHAANTAALLRGHALLDAVRPGIAIFGAAPVPSPDKKGFGLRPVMRVRTEVVSVRSVPAGASVGYGGLWRAPRPSVIATIPMGYADGLLRLTGDSVAAGAPKPGVRQGGGHVLVRGTRAPFVGAVSMDMAMIDVTDVAGARVGDEAVVLGAQDGPLGKDVITVVEVAERAGAIAWEVMTSISRRVPRFYREP
jgi:alanine racemase